jgi:hypothetical protein
MFLIQGKYVGKRFDLDKVTYDRLKLASETYGVPQAVIMRTGLSMILDKIEKEKKFVRIEEG